MNLRYVILLCAAVSLPLDAQMMQRRGGLGQRIERMREASRREHAVAVPAGATAVRDVAYGNDPAQHFDVYLPANARNAPVLFYVHGGGWANGDKTNPGLENKLAYWLPKGYAVVSADYRLVPKATPLQQAQDIAHAVATVQAHAQEWKLDPERLVLMGHSAGAHLVVLLGAKPSLLADAGARRPRAVVSLDSGALDVPALMSLPRVPQLYHQAFGSDHREWVAASPTDQLTRGALPMLLVCSSERRVPTSPCDEANGFARKAATLGVTTQVLPEPMQHGEINHDLGLPSAYTTAVGQYIDAHMR